MDVLIRPTDPRRRQLRFAALIAGLTTIAILLVWLGQPAGVVLLPMIGLLCAAVERRDQRARALAQQLAAGRLVEKFEVQRGEWGELSRALNHLLQEQRVQHRLRPAMPAPLPQEAVQALLGGNLSTSDKPRMTTVLLVSHFGRASEREGRGTKAALVAWQALAYAAQEEAQRHGALLQPCGDAIMLAFGVFTERPTGESLRTALVVAKSLQRNWRDRGINAGGPLVLSLASGPALTMALPGLGYCVIGLPVEQAVQLQYIARHARRRGLVCSEGVYYALRHSNSVGWQPTELRIPASNHPQVVYSWVERET